MFKYGPANILECQKLAETLARAAGVIIKEHFGRTIGIEFKNGEKNTIQTMHLLVKKLIKRIINQAKNPNMCGSLILWMER